MADEYAQNLPDIPERTATAGTDLIHVNSGGSDYKQTKANFLKGDFQHIFNNTSALTTQVDALPVGTFFGSISAYGSQTATGLPINANCYVKATKMSATTASVEIWSSADVEGQHYISTKTSNTWGSWVHVPSRSEITSLNNSLTNSLKLGDWTANLTLPYTPTSDGFISVWLNPSSASGAYARLSVTGDSHAMGLNAKGGDGVTLVFPIKKNATVSQTALSNGTLSVRFISIFG